MSLVLDLIEPTLENVAWFRVAYADAPVLSVGPYRQIPASFAFPESTLAAVPPAIC